MERLSRERDTLLDLRDRGVPAVLHAGARRRHARSRPTARSTAYRSKRVNGCGSRGPWRTATRRSSEHPNEIVLDRKGNRHFSFGLGVTVAWVPTSPATVFSRCSRRCSTGCQTSPAIQPAPRTTRPSGSSRACSTLLATFTPGRRLGLVWTDAGAPATGVRRAGTGAADHRTQDAAVISW